MNKLHSIKKCWLSRKRQWAYYVESVEEVSVVEEPMCEQEMEEHYQQVENLTEDEPTEINVVPAFENGQRMVLGRWMCFLDSLVGNVLSEKCNQPLFLLLLILNEPTRVILNLGLYCQSTSTPSSSSSSSSWSPCGGSLAKELHEPALHTEPAEPRTIEEERVEYQVQGHPLEIRLTRLKLWLLKEIGFMLC